MTSFVDPSLASGPFGGAAVRAVSHEDQLGRHLFADQGENFDDVGDALDGTEIGEVHHDGLAIGRPFGALLGIVVAAIEIAIDEIGNDFDGPLDVELLDGLFLEVVRDGGDAIGLLDGESRDREKAAVAADQGDVRAVQRGDEGQAAGERPWSGPAAR